MCEVGPLRCPQTLPQTSFRKTKSAITRSSIKLRNSKFEQGVTRYRGMGVTSRYISIIIIISN